VVDIREEGFTTEFPNVVESIRKKIPIWMIFLEASDETLVQRFSESRRPHPLTRKKSVVESVLLERERLAEIKKMADEVIDTTALSVWDLKKILTRRFLRRKTQQMQIVIVSFGYKYGIPVDSDLVFDTRFLPNPFYINTLREKTGRLTISVGCTGGKHRSVVCGEQLKKHLRTNSTNVRIYHRDVYK
jgi:UPF0042 nucleotide-binding protein